ncbi:uncharacterized protein DUF1833 [Stenotrophomonas maltophilia]|uniref:DUF1833 family protein n=1 Tax=Stenotrophomonas chelatiphaga TaxID=517011 RepID=UPI000F4B0321|nr:DUF1833 family protein [Stenotrophomonas chelatiphaga]MCS4231356.1 hypothetical protein [Stenotrophomonas chelatiphaga]ROQ42457.1 uncharacterized protein DUF1833 [Stenotrophomonas maltophilia]
MSTFTERRQRVTDPVGTLALLEVSAPSFAETLRICNDQRDWVSQGLTFIGAQFGFKLPDDVNGQAPRAQLVISNVGRAITEDLERLAPGELVTARLMITDRADVNVIEQDHYLPMMTVSVTPQAATSACGVDYFTRQQAVRLRFNAHIAPGIY